MIKSLFSWIKNHKLSSILLIVIGVIILQGVSQSPIMYSLGSSGQPYSEQYGIGGNEIMPIQKSQPGYAPSEASYAEGAVVDSSSPITVNKRMTSKNYNLSIVSKNIKQTIEKIVNEVESSGGFVVSNSQKDYQDTESAYVTVRVPVERAKRLLGVVKSNSQKVVSQEENTSDITDQYTNTKEHLRLLEGTKAKFEEVWKSAIKTEDMLLTLREIQNIQQEIDRLTGQEKYFEEIAKYSYFYVNLSKDEMDLPYLPGESWSADLVFRSAVRELVRTARGVATSAIWIAVFAAIWLPLSAIVFFIIKRFGKQIWG